MSCYFLLHLLSQVKIIDRSLFRIRIFTPKCTKLHKFVSIFSNMFPGGDTPGPNNWREASKMSKTLDQDERSRSHFFRAFAVAETTRHAPAGVEFATPRSQVRCPNHYTTEPPTVRTCATCLLSATTCLEEKSLWYFEQTSPNTAGRFLNFLHCRNLHEFSNKGITKHPTSPQTRRFITL